MIDDAMREELNALIDDALDEPAAAALRARLETEPELRAEYERLRRVAELVRGLPTPSAGVADAVMAELPAESAPAPVHRLSAWKWGGGIAAAAAAVVIGITLWHDPEPTTDLLEAREPAPAKEELRRLEKEGVPPGAPMAGKARARAKQEVPEGRDEARDGALDEAMAPERKAADLEEPGILSLVEDRRAQLGPADRARYLDGVAQAEDAELALHRRALRLDAPAASFASSAKGSETMVLGTRVADKAEAQRLQAAMLRLFREPPRETSRAAETPRISKTKKAEPATVVRRGGTKADGEVVVRRTVTVTEAMLISDWLRRTGLSARPERGTLRGGAVQAGGTVSGRAEEGAKKKDAPTVTVELRIRYGPPPKQRTRPSDDD